jgi:hypothetical protein
MFSTYFDALDWTHSIPDSLNTQAWQRSRQQVTAWAQWNAYLNQICLDLCLQHFQAEIWHNAVGMSDRQADQTWAFVNGSVITVGDQRLALIPSEAIDQTELEVAQEWIDIPSWAADYYLAVYITPDLQTLHIAGYATHQQIKQQGFLNSNSRSYQLDLELLTSDLNLLRLSVDRYSSQQTRDAISPLAPLPETQAQNLIQRLGTVTELLPRLEVPFTLWAALLENWHEQLYRQRQGTANLSVVTRLGEWLQGQFNRAWQPAEQVLAVERIAMAARSDGSESSAVDRVKVIAVGDGQVGLWINLTPLDESEVRIDLQVHPIGDELYLPGDMELRLLSAEGMEVIQARATITETIRLQFRARYDEAFQLEMTCNDHVVTEQFTL